MTTACAANASLDALGEHPRRRVLPVLDLRGAVPKIARCETPQRAALLENERVGFRPVQLATNRAAGGQSAPRGDAVQKPKCQKACGSRFD
jgi:hypothetical protein